ncbi:MAG: hypothetical protein CW691_07350 [Candidatus Bathyarchaeum sp.]|nr:MAG: hypothetical protein CW691_07350 [Candidatus Bathyarchaeum sp.]
MLGYRPLVYFWIAEYTDGCALPQFDPKTGKENRFSEVDCQKLCRFGWYAFSPKLTKKILETEKTVVIPTSNRSYSVTLERNDKLVAYRTNTIKLQTRKSGIGYGETVYVLGIEGKKVIQIDEGGNVVNESC